jgi:hypothetical protein
MAKYKLLAYCGLYCGGCRSYFQNSDVNCHGCRVEETLVDDCPTKICAEKRQLLHCGECDEFPCQMLNDFYNDGIKHHALALTNIKRIKGIGLSAWMQEQEVKHTCECGKRRLWFETKCRELR